MTDQLVFDLHQRATMLALALADPCEFHIVIYRAPGSDEKWLCGKSEAGNAALEYLWGQGLMERYPEENYLKFKEK